MVVQITLPPPNTGTHPVCIPYASASTKSNFLLSVGFFSFSIYLPFGDCMDLYCHSQTILSRKNQWFKYFKQREVKSVLQKQGGTTRVIGQNPSVEVLCSPLCCLNYREGFEFHQRLQAAMGSHDIASILLSFSWLWFWSLILEGKCCFCFS